MLLLSSSAYPQYLRKWILGLRGFLRTGLSCGSFSGMHRTSSNGWQEHWLESKTLTHNYYFDGISLLCICLFLAVGALVLVLSVQVVYLEVFLHALLHLHSFLSVLHESVIPVLLVVASWEVDVQTQNKVCLHLNWLIAAGVTLNLALVHPSKYFVYWSLFLVLNHFGHRCFEREEGSH